MSERVPRHVRSRKRHRTLQSVVLRKREKRYALRNRLYVGGHRYYEGFAAVLVRRLSSTGRRLGHDHVVSRCRDYRG